ncbi:hypothetical protein TSTA_108040 [Talaromyces stipitatus ATCC 10500]|uniref:Uncharacterized protein n=1 Tax=Talaromyces stipitatus (strain ATCC 10500 / CBS 375.48 / QM 6759 / NRRL 1006) TaxID=441959 RepID=B8MUB0_TALSN|nr:uncharacterized protein TSTA_108040 [Talaromyces stipitatus ATCC 10500]EED11614.1 hypothetical protein TSTA_108040 [Talaromyces stipitatus ATCC 10500]
MVKKRFQHQWDHCSWSAGTIWRSLDTAETSQKWGRKTIDESLRRKAISNFAVPSNSNVVDPIVVPDLPLDEAVKRYAEWHKTQVASQKMKDNVDLACQIALANGYDLSQIDKDRNWNEYADEGVMKGVAIRWTGQVREWLNHYEPLF